MLLTPAFFILTVGLVFLRLFPIVLQGVAWVVARMQGTAVLIGMWQLVRNPTHYSRLVLLLMLATAVGMFAASFGATLDRSYADRAAYQSGSQLRVSEIRRTPANGPNEMLDTMRTTAGARATPAPSCASAAARAPASTATTSHCWASTRRASPASATSATTSPASRCARSWARAGAVRGAEGRAVDPCGRALARRLGQPDRPQGPRRYRRATCATASGATSRLRAGAGQRRRAAAGLELPGRRPDARVAGRLAGQHAVRQRAAAGPVRGRVARRCVSSRASRPCRARCSSMRCRASTRPRCPGRWRPTAC